jgi:hypothetical protein
VDGERELPYVLAWRIPSCGVGRVIWTITQDTPLCPSSTTFDHNSSRFGVFLLVWRGTKKKWRESESGKQFSFGHLLEQLEAKAADILRNRNDLEEIRIVGIDLTTRDTRH